MYYLAVDLVGVRIAGASMVAKCVLDAALSHSCLSRITAFGSPVGIRSGKDLFNMLAWSSRPLEEHSVFRRVLWLMNDFSRSLDKSRADVGLCLGNGGLGSGRVPICVFVHQSLPFSDEALSRCDTSMQFRMSVIKQIMSFSCRRADLVAVQTDTMARWVTSVFGILPGRVQVFTPGAPEFPDEGAQAPANAQGSVLYVGNTAGYKNLAALEAAFGIIKTKHPGFLMTWITLPGSRPPDDTRIAHYSGIGRDEIAAAYLAARALVMPSLVETVGLPMLEAMKLGCPVAAADRPYAHDICGDAAVYFDPLDPEDIAQVLLRLDTDEALRRELIEKGRKREAAFSEAKPYERLIDELVKLAEARKAQ